MPSSISHIIAGSSLGYGLYYKKYTAPLWAIVALLSVFPDFDVIAFFLGIPYGDVLGHRGLFHSLFFAFIASFAFAYLYFYRLKKSPGDFWYGFLVLFFVSSLHPLLDMLTNGGLGIGILMPFNNTRYFFPSRPIAVSPIAVRIFFSGKGFMVVQNEIKWVIIPSLVIIIATAVVKSIRTKYGGKTK
jgi:inner membrane protein